MPGKVAKIGSSAIGSVLFDDWRKEIGVNQEDFSSFHFDTLYGAVETGRHPVRFLQRAVPSGKTCARSNAARLRDALMNMIVYQGRYRICFGRAAGGTCFEFRAPAIGDRRAAHARDDRRNAPRLADVRAAHRLLRQLRKSRSAKDARTPRLRKQAPARQPFNVDIDKLARTSSPTKTSSIRERKISTPDG